MTQRNSDLIREHARDKYVKSAILAGRPELSIRVRDVLNDLPNTSPPQICSALRTSRFLVENGLEISKIDGPPSKKSTTVVFHYRVANAAASLQLEKDSASAQPPANEETPEEWAHRLTEKLRGLLKEELAEYGGGEAFIRWIRSDETDVEPGKQAAEEHAA